MLPTVIKSRPSAEADFQPLSEYQSQTPETFFDGKPVLYFHDEHVKAWCSPEQSGRLYFFSGNESDEKPPTAPEAHALENDGGKHLREEDKVEVFVSSHKLILFSHNTQTGIEIPYPSISLHATKNFKSRAAPDGDDASKFLGVYMQLEFSGDGGDEDDESADPLELTLVPYNQDGSAATIDPLNAQRASALFAQISACQNLHPDPADEDEDEDGEYYGGGGDGDGEDPLDRIVFEGEALEGLPGAFRGDAAGGLPPPMPGSSGWITADNVQDYFDAEGNWIGGGGAEAVISGELGEGAGRVRGRDEVDGGDGDGADGEGAAGGVNGSEAQGDNDPKRPRTE